MKMIHAYIRPARAERVLDRLAELGMHNATLTHVTSVGPDSADPSSSKVNLEYGRAANRSVKIEFFCPDEWESKCVAILCEAASTHHAGDGVVMVADIEQLVQIQTGKPIGDKK